MENNSQAVEETVLDQAQYWRLVPPWLANPSRRPWRAAGRYSPLVAVTQRLLLLSPGDRYSAAASAAGQVPYDAQAELGSIGRQT